MCAGINQAVTGHWRSASTRGLDMDKGGRRRRSGAAGNWLSNTVARNMTVASSGRDSRLARTHRDLDLSGDAGRRTILAADGRDDAVAI